MFDGGRGWMTGCVLLAGRPSGGKSPGLNRLLMLVRCPGDIVSDAQSTPPVKVGAPWTLSSCPHSSVSGDRDHNAPTLTGGV
jgi:hypothetical protein